MIPPYRVCFVVTVVVIVVVLGNKIILACTYIYTSLHTHTIIFNYAHICTVV